MANNYKQGTVQPNFPISSVTDFEKELLMQYGFSYQIDDSSEERTLYFFIKEWDRDYIDHLDVDLVSECAQQGDLIASNVLRYIQNYSSNNLVEYVSKTFPWEVIFQEILKKPECEGIFDICVEGAYTCDKLRAGEIGGWICRITRESIQYETTSDAFKRMKGELDFLEALELVWQLADGNCLDQDNDPDPDDPDESDGNEIIIECRRQRRALDKVGDYLKIHKPTKC